MATIGTLTANLTLESAAFINNLSRSADAMNRTATQIEQQTGAITGGFNKAAGALKSFATGLVGVVSVGTIANMAKETFAWADSLQELGERVGFSVQKLQELQQAGELTNVSQQQIITNLEQFGRRLGEAATGSGELAKTLEANNIALQNSDGTLRSVSEVFDEYVALIANAETQQEALSLAVDGFGRSGAGFVTTIKEMNANVGQFNVLTDQQVATLAKYDDKITKTTELLNFGFRAALAEIISSTETDIQNLVAIWDNITGAIQSVTNAFVAMKDNALAAVEQMVSGIEQALGQRMKKVAQASASSTIGIALQWKKVYDAVVGQSYVPDMMDGIEREFKRLPAIAVAPTKSATAAVDSEFARLAQRQQQHVQTAVQNGAALPAAATGIAAEQQADILAEPFKNALRDVQSSFTDTFREIFQGGVTSFQDIADQAHKIFIDLAANLATTAIFNPQALSGILGFAGPGAAGAAGSWSGGSWFAQRPGLAQGAAGAGAGLAGGLAFGGLAGGAAGGGVAGGFAGAGAGALTGATLGAAAGPWGAAIGAGVGAIAGGLMGAFSGGGGGSHKGGRVFGGLGTTGGPAGFGFVKEMDAAISQLLNSRQRAAVDAVLARSAGARFSFSGELSQGTIEHVAGVRGREIARGLGFREQGIASGATAPGQVVANIQTALEARRAIEDLTSRVTAFDRQTEDLGLQFEDLRAKAKQFGISTAGLTEAQKRATDDLRKAQDASIAAAFDPFKALSAPLDALAKEFEFKDLSPAAQFAKAQEEFKRITSEAAGGSIPAIQQFEAAARLFVELAGQVGASPGQTAAVSQVQTAIGRISESIERSQAEASRGVESVIERADRNNVDTLNELRDSIVDALRKLESTIRNA